MATINPNKNDEILERFHFLIVFPITIIEKNIKPKQSLIIVDQAFPIHQKIGKVFNEIIFLEEFPVAKGKHTLNVYKIYLGKV